MPKIQLSVPQAAQFVFRWASRMDKAGMYQSALTGVDRLSKLPDWTGSEGNTLSSEDLEVLAVGTRVVCSHLWMEGRMPEQVSTHLAQLKAEVQAVLPSRLPADCTLEDFADTLNDFSRWLYDQRMAISSTHLERVPATFRRGITLFDSLRNMSGVRDGIPKNAPDPFTTAMSKKGTPNEWTLLEAATVISSLLKARFFFAGPIPPGVDSSRVTAARWRHISGLLCQHPELFDDYSMMSAPGLAAIFDQTLLYWRDDPCFRDLICHRLQPESFPREYMTGPRQLFEAALASDSAHLPDNGTWKQPAAPGSANDVSRSPTASELDAPYELDDSPDQGSSMPFTTPMIDTDQTGDETPLPWSVDLQYMLLAPCPWGETLASGWWPHDPLCS